MHGKIAGEQADATLRGEILDQAVGQLLREIKAHAEKKGQPIDPAQLRKDDFSERFIQIVEEV